MSETGRAVVRGIGAAAALIAVITVLARLAGFGRNLVFARTVGTTCVGDTYIAANTVPNIVFEIVMGGALASLVVPMLAGSIARGDRARTNQISSSLLSWTVLILLPVSGLIAVLALPLSRGLLAGSECSGAAELGARMLLVFAPQVLLYGVGIVLTGILQAHERFIGPALAPLLSSVVVAAAYVLYRISAGVPESVAELDGRSELILSVGTTIGVVALALVLVIPLRATGVRLRPSLRFPEGVATRVRRLAVAGVATLAGQQIAVLVALRLANDGAPAGTQVLYFLAMTVFMLPWGALAVPLATSAFPRLSAAYDRGDTDGYRRALAPTAGALLVACLIGSAAMIAVAAPAARVFIQGTGVTGAAESVQRLAATIIAFAPGLAGYGLVALLTRALYARGLWKSPTVAVVSGWSVTVLADIVLSAVLRAEQRGVALAAGHSIGVLVAGVALVVVTVRAAGGEALAGTPRLAATALLAGALGVGAGAVLAGIWDGGGVLLAVVQTLAVGVLTVAVAAGTMLLLARGPVRVVLAGLRGAPAAPVGAVVE